MQPRRFRERIRWKILKAAGFCCILVVIWALFGKWTARLRDDYSYAHVDIGTERDAVFVEGCVDPQSYQQQAGYVPQNATFVMLTRNEELSGVLSTIHSIERHFNQWYQYPYVFINDESFTDEFVRQVKAATRAEIRFGVLSDLEWEFPPDVREKLVFKESIENQGDRGIMYGSLESYHKMCRFYSGAFYKHPLVAQYEWYWRIEPDVEFFCDLTYDPFYEMSRTGKKYGFTVFLEELYWSVPNLFRYTRSFIRQNHIQTGNLWHLFVKDYNIVSGDSVLESFINHEAEIESEVVTQMKIQALMDAAKKDGSDDLDSEALEFLVDRALRRVPIIEDKFDNEEFNLCHFWSNFEIARVDLFNSGLYAKFFEFLEKSGGFWTERWGDAPVHSLGLGLMLDVEDVHYFRDIGYQHSTIIHCPMNKADAQLPYVENPDYSKVSQVNNDMYKIFSHVTRTKGQNEDVGVGCRCVCPKDADIEDSNQCFGKWYDITRDDYESPTALKLNLDLEED
ncbi:LANO_0H06216g1_1 [Lachancea nothofagi CBS 11611]|uniref:LANO_0H06216g1_1 n=1 Tax=Lachancea nothofagi CBS 11611 TaxID=1266666 RepID=A0A1G4KLM6_9SACH|nr:LANO_0H06216g1_1 [Lachancea nothofagi CBS 11611]